MESDNLDAVISVGYRVNLTTEANELVATIYDRMPVILRPEDEDQWLDPGADLAALKRMLVPYAGRELHAYPVSPLVNSPRNDTPECLEPVAS
jgi:putative SOS response-associated peptidase YedK